jgi:histidine triad (HIT) family protein
MSHEPTCIFCMIAAGRSPASVVSDDENVISFMDINPVTPGHLLVVPKEHHAKIATIPAGIMAEMILVGQRLTAALRASPIRTEGVNLFLADGSAAGQEVMHAHLHLIPRWHGDGLHISISRKGIPTREQLEETAVAIRNAISE